MSTFSCSRFFILSFVFLSFIYPTDQVVGDRIHIPSYVFEDQVSGQKVLNSERATNAVFAHRNGIKGQTKTGKRLVAAVIDFGINPLLPHMQALRKKGLIHPAALKPYNPYMLNPDKNFENSQLISWFNKLCILETEDFSAFTPQQKEWKKQREESLRKQQILRKALNELKDRKCCLLEYNKPQAINHGSGVIHALHKIAPEVSLLPIDCSLICRVARAQGRVLTQAQGFAQAIWTAIRYKADCINLSLDFGYLDQQGFKAMAEAVRKGIVLIIAAGNDSINNRRPVFINEFWDDKKNIIAESKNKKLFEVLKGQGIIFAGSTGINQAGKEEISEYSQHPAENQKRNFLLTPGEHLNIQVNTNPHRLTRGTSFSAPGIAGAFLNLKQYCLDRKYKATSKDLLNILYDSGYDIRFRHVRLGNKVNTYKSVDVWRACQWADQKFSPKPTPPVVKRPILKRHTLQIAKPVVLRKGKVQPKLIPPAAKRSIAQVVKPVAIRRARIESQPIRPILKRPVAQVVKPAVVGKGKIQPKPVVVKAILLPKKKVIIKMVPRPVRSRS